MGTLPALVTMLVAFMPVAGQAQDAPLWGGLKPGRHGVGFREMTAGSGTPVVMWYPTSCGAGPTLRFGAYGGAHGSASPTRIGALPTRARLDASVARGRYPVVLYASDGDRADNTVLAEYLASHGYVVVAALGGPAALDAALEVVASFSSADRGAIAALGYGRGAQIALDHAARTPAVRAVVALAPPPTFDVGALGDGRPALVFQASGPDGPRLAGLRGSGTLAITVPRSTRDSFGDLAAIRAVRGGRDDEAPDHRRVIGGVTHAFLDGVLRSWGPSVTDLGARLRRAGLDVTSGVPD
jgi:hypothetical protein